jgi:hypothetical protein
VDGGLSAAMISLLPTDSFDGSKEIATTLEFLHRKALRKTPRRGPAKRPRRARAR